MTTDELMRLADDYAEESRLAGRGEESGPDETRLALLAAVERLTAQRDRLADALRAIAAIEDLMFGGDWEEIEQARNIARAALESL